MSNIRLFFPKSLSFNLTDKLDKSQSHYVSKVMRVKENEVFSLFNSSGEWEAGGCDQEVEGRHARHFLALRCR